MPHFAELNPTTNEVLRVITARSRIWCEYNLDGTWVQTHKATEGKNYAGKGFTYHPDKENFSPPQPFASWTLDDDCAWQPPTPYPTDGNMHAWNEDTQSWEQLNVGS